MTRAGAALVEVLGAHGVTHVFGLVGSSTMEIYDALYHRPAIRYVGAKDERAAAGMADGFARASLGLGVVLAGQSGPGVTNLVSGLAAARAARSPVVAIGGAVTTGHWQLDAFQEVDQESLLKPVTKAVLTAPRASRVVDTVDRACRIARTHPMGPVYVNIPRDVLAGECDEPVVAPWTPEGRDVVDLAAADRVVTILRNARRPVIVAGGGVKASRVGELVCELARRLGAPVATSAGHRDGVPNDFELFLGQMGPRGSSLANDVIKEADVVLGLGTRFGFNSTFFDRTVFATDATIVQSDIDPLALGRYIPDAFVVHAESRTLTTLLVNAFTRDPEKNTDAAWTRGVLARVEQMRRQRAQKPDDGPSIGPDVFFHTMRHHLPREAIVTLDAGTWCLKASEQLDFFDPPSLFTPLDFASLGFAFPAAIGAQFARPDRRCVAVIGDGGALFAISELSTVREHSLPVVLVIMDNQAWGAEKAYQQDYYGSRFIGTDLPGQDFATIAEGFGVTARRATKADELSDALEEAFSVREPRVIAVDVDRNVMHSFRKDMFESRTGKKGPSHKVRG